MAEYLSQLTSTQLFLLNGIIEGLVGVMEVVSPGTILQTKKLHDHGRFYTGFFGPLLFAMSAVSVLIGKYPDENNGAKHLFAFGWLLYHIGATLNCFKKVIGGKKSMIGGTVFHSFLTASFVAYLIANNVGLDLFLPF